MTKIKTIAPAPLSPDFNIEKVVALIREGAGKLKKAGEMIAAEMDRNPAGDVVGRLSRDYRMSFKLVRCIVAIGRGTMLPEVMGFPCLENLPISEQKKALDGPVDFLCADNSVIKVDLLPAEPRVRAQVVGPKGIRTVEQQRERLEAIENARKARETVDIPWEVKGKFLHVYGATVLSKGALKKILKEMD